MEMARVVDQKMIYFLPGMIASLKAFVILIFTTLLAGILIC
jgi:hypothetical protein